MNKHKTKIFKDAFAAHSETIHPGELVHKIDIVREDTFVPLMGQMWNKAKERYKKRNQRDAMAFAKWCATNYYESSGHWLIKTSQLQDFKRTEDLYNIWKEQKNG